MHKRCHLIHRSSSPTHLHRQTKTILVLHSVVTSSAVLPILWQIMKGKNKLCSRDADRQTDSRRQVDVKGDCFHSILGNGILPTETTVVDRQNISMNTCSPRKMRWGICRCHLRRHDRWSRWRRKHGLKVLTTQVPTPCFQYLCKETWNLCS